MKQSVLLFTLLSFLFTSCEDESTNSAAELGSSDKVLLLQVDYMTNAFMAGKEFNFPTFSDITISSTYQPPGDFGGIQLFYSEINEMLFDGSIVWMGTGQISYPILEPTSSFETSSNLVEVPYVSLFEVIMYDEFAYYPDEIEYSSIWHSISNLSLVNEYRASNPDGEVNLLLYTPSVGIGDPYEWSWIVIINN